MKNLYTLFQKLFVLVCLLLLVEGNSFGQYSPKFSIEPAKGNPKDQVRTDQISIPFQRNIGQYNKAVQYQALGLNNTVVRFMNDKVVFSYKESETNKENKSVHLKGAVWNMNFKGANPKAYYEASDKQITTYNYLRSATNESENITNIPSYGKISLKKAYDNIDIQYYSNTEGYLKYDVVVYPGGNLNDVRLGFEGIKSIKLDKGGDLTINTPTGEFKELRPVSWQIINGKKVSVDVQYALIDKTTYGYKVNGSYNPEYDLIVDPITLVWASYLIRPNSSLSSMSGTDAYVLDIDIDDLTGIPFICGYTAEQADKMPTTVGAYDTLCNSSVGYSPFSQTDCDWDGSFDDVLKTWSQVGDAFIAKMSADGHQLLWCTLLGNENSGEQAYGIALLQDGNSNPKVAVAGLTLSNDFPTTSGCYDNSYGGNTDAFVAILNNNGNQLLRSTYFGAGARDQAFDLEYQSGKLYLCGTAGTGFPTTVGASQTTFGAGSIDAFAAIFDTTLTGAASLQASTFYGGSDCDNAFALEVNASGQVFIAGVTESSNLPGVSGFFDATSNGAIDGFVVKFNATLTSRVFATYLGGTGNDYCYDISIAKGDRALVCGSTTSSAFPTTSGAYDATIQGRDAFITILNPTGTALSRSTVIGGTDQGGGTAGDDGERFFGVTVDCNNNIYATGMVSGGSTGSVPSLPLVNPLQATYGGGGYDLIIVQFDSTLTGNGSLKNSTVFGGNDEDYIFLPSPITNALGMFVPGVSHSTNFSPSPDPNVYQFNHNTDNEDNPLIYFFRFDPPAISGNNPCVGGTINLTMEAAQTYSWSGPNGFTSTVQNPTIPNATIAMSGTYTCIILPIGSTCQTSNSVIVTVNALPTITVTPANPFRCGAGTQAVTATGGTTYTWSPATGLNQTTGATVTATLAVGTTTYTVTGTNANGCSSTASVSMIADTVPVITFTGPTATCSGSNANITAVVSNTTVIGYLWSTGATVASVSVPAGTYTVTVTALGGCTATATRVITTATNPTTPTITGPASKCASAPAVTFDAGTGGGTYTSFLWSTSATTQTISVSTAGTYTVTVTNAAGCTASATKTFTVNPNPTTSITGPASKCANDPAVTFDAGAGFTAYSWSTGATTQTISVSVAGTYTVTVTNASSCTGSATKSLTVNPNPSTSITGPASKCTSDPAVTFDAGAGFTTYAWSSGATTQTISVSAAGTYTVTVSNSFGCTGTATKAFTVNANPTTSISGPAAICSGQSATYNAGAGFTTYLWSTGATTQTISVSVAATYTVTVSNANNCTVSATKALTVNSNPTPTISGPASKCTNDAAVTFDAGAGFTAYSWSTGATTQTISVSAAGTYTVTVTNASNCTETATRAFTVNPNPTTSITGPSSKCTNDPAVTFDAGSGFTTYAWSTGATTQTISVSAAGTYTVTVSNSFGCTGTATKAFTVNPNPTTSVTGPSSKCANDPAVTFDAGVGFTTYSWSTGATTQTIPVSATGTYTVTVSNSFGCTGTATKAFTVNPNPAPVISGPETICPGQTPSLDAGAGFATYSWSTGATTQTIVINATGTYTVTVTNGFGCSASNSKVVVSGVCTMNISGTVWDDANGSAAGTFTNIFTAGENGTNAGGLFAILVDATTGNVLQSVAVNSNGTYSFPGVPVNTNVTIQLSTTAGTVGNTPPSIGIPSNWINTSPLAYTTFNSGIVDIFNKDFGIEQLPNSDDKNAPSQQNPGGTTQVTAPTLTGSDPEDGVYGAGATIKITTLATNGTLYYNGVPVTLNQVITNYNPAFLTVDPNDGNVTVTFNYAEIDAAGQQDPTPALVTMPFGVASVSGTVWDDANGSAAGTLNNIFTAGEVGTNGGGLSANLVDATTGNVIATIPVNANGTYSFSAPINTDVYVTITTTAGTVGQPSPATGVNANWVATSPLTYTTFNTGTQANPNKDFGIEQLPNSDDKNAPSQQNPGGTTQVTAPTLTGSDPEDGVYGAGATIKITTLATNGTLYYNGVPVTLNQVITNYNPAFLTVDPNDGNVTVTFNYAEIDAAGQQDPTPALVTMPFGVASVSGTVWDDANGSAAGTLNNIFTAGEVGTNGGGLSANLVDATTGNVIATIPVNANGTYSFSAPINTDVYVTITTTAGTVGQPSPATGVNANWVATSPLTYTTFNTGTQANPNKDFGIEQLPNSDDKNAPSQQNPGGTTQVTAPTLTGSDPEDGVYGAGATIKITTLATNGTLYYNGVPVTLNQVITNYNPAFLTVDPNDGNVTVTFNYAEIDAAGQQDPTPALVTMPFGVASVSGTVWDDANGSAAGTLNNIFTAGEVGTNGGGLSANLVDANTGNVIATIPVNANGTYSFSAPINTDVYVTITTTAGTIGQPSPATGVNANWVATSPLTYTTFNTGTQANPNKDFGIEQLPNSDDKNAANQQNPGGTTQVTVPTLTGSDPEDGVYGAGATIKITTLASNGTLYYNGVPVTLNQVITNYTPALLTVDPDFGNVTVTFTYAEIDAAGQQDPTPATVTMPFGIASVSGTVWDDANGSAAGTLNNIFTAGEVGTNGGGLSANLVDANTGNVIATIPVNANGTYSFSAPIFTDVYVTITTTPGVIGQPSPATGVNANWVATSPLTYTTFNTGITSNDNKDFGIEQLPNSDDKTEPSQLNPGGTVQVAVPTLTGSDPEDGLYGTGATLKITSLPSNGILYYNGIPVTLNQVITNYTPALLTVDPDNGVVTVVFTYAERDAAGQYDPTPAIVTMPFGNNVPVANVDYNSTNEDIPIIGATVVLNDTPSPDGGNIYNNVCPVCTTTPNGTLTFNPNGTYNYTPDPNFTGVDNFIYQICDVDGDCDTAIVYITITPVDEQPVAVVDNFITAEDVPIIGQSVTGNDTPSPDGGNIYNNVCPVCTTTPNGTLTFNPNGTFNYTPDPNFTGVDNFIYQICDVDGDCDTAIVYITITPVDEQPVAVVDNFTTAEDVPIIGQSVTGNDTPSPDGGNTYNNVCPVCTTTPNGTLTFNPNGTFNYTPDPNFTGVDNFIYQICDVDGDCDTAIVYITITPEDEQPVAVVDYNTTNEDNPIIGATVVNNDTPSPDGGNTYNNVCPVCTTTPNGTLTFNPDGTYNYTPDPNFTGVDNFVYQICDVDGDCDTAIVYITITPEDEQPVAVVDYNTTNEDNPIIGATVVNNDTPSPDGGNTYNNVCPVCTTTPNGTLTFNPNGTYNYTPDPNFTGVDNFVYQICDVDGDCDTAIVYITITPVDEQPVAVVDNFTTAEDVPIIGQSVTGNDTPSPDGGNTYNNVCPVCTTTPNGTLTFNPNGTFNYTPDPNFTGVDNFIYQICDVDGDCDTAIVYITITPVDEQPVAVVDYNTTNEDNPIIGATVVTNDTPSPDGGNTYNNVCPVCTTTPNGTLTFNPNGTYNYTPDPNFTGVDNFVYQICDVDGDCDTAIVYITITPVDEQPVAVVDNFTTAEDVPIIGQSVTGNDTPSPDGGNTYNNVCPVCTTTPNGTLTFNPNGTFNYTPDPNFTGVDNFIYQICDVDGDCDTAIVYITITPVDEQPVAVVDNNSTGENVPIIGATVVTNDTPSPDGGNVYNNVCPVCTTTPNGTLTFSPNGSYNYTPNNGFTGVDQFVYQICDVDGDCDTAIVYITIIPSTLSANCLLINNALCFAATNGNVTVNASGGLTPYQYLWSNGKTTANNYLIGFGTYTVVVSDANNATRSCTVTVTQPTPMGASNTKTNISCFGGSNGTINVTINGGTPPYTYIWNTGQTTEDRTFLTIGTYTVTASDVNGCQASTSATLTQPTQMLTNNVKTNITCFGANNGTIDVSVSGGIPGYTYLWNDGATTEDRTGLSVGTFTITVFDSNGCASSTSATVAEPTALVATATPTVVSCNGGSNGTITLSPSGGTPNYSYLWNGGSTTQNRSGLTAGIYTVTITDANGCTITRSATIAEPTALVATATPTAVSCNGGSNGTITLSPSGGTPNYSYLWNGGSTIQNRSGLTAGIYTVTITDANGCTITRSATVAEPTALAATATPTAVSCNGGSNGTITLSPSGGTPNYSYLWNSGATTQSRSGLTAGTYTVTITDANGCTITRSATVTEPTALAATVTPTAVSCNGGSNGTITLSPSGGTPNYSYLWNGGATSQNRSGLTASTYTVTIADSNGCTITRSATVAEPTALAATATPTAVSCNGGSNGTITLSPSGGTPNYSYLWNSGATTQSRSGLTAGIYTVTITDANGCTITRSATVAEPTALAATATPTAVSCNGGSNGTITLSPTGGTPNYSFLWNGGSTTQNRSGLTAGTYTVTITDANGCTITRSANVTEPTALAATATPTAVSCNGGSNGTITLSPSGGTPNYSYLWNGGSTTQNRSGLTAGTYTVTITDANGCTITRSATITEPTALSATATPSPVACTGANNGSINVSTSGGTPSYSYLWNGGVTTQNRTSLGSGTYTVTITDANGCTITRSATIIEVPTLAATATPSPVSCNGGNNGSIALSPSGGTPGYSYLWNSGATTQNRSGLTAGIYTVTITDANGCTITRSATVTEPTALTATATSTAVSCTGGSNGTITLSPSGGTPNYSYLWNSGATSQNRSGLIAGTYTVTMTDANGCTLTRSATVTEPTALVVTNTKTNVSCKGGNNGSITVSVSGGTPAYSYIWNNGATTKNRTGLIAGTYTVTVTDANGCTKKTSAVITQPTAIVNSLTKTNVSCFGGNNGSITSNVSGGTPGYTYLWTTGSTNSSISNLVKGTYTVTVTDSKGCTKTSSNTITQPIKLVVNFTNVISACGFASATSLAAGGTPPYNYLWSTGNTTGVITNLPSGVYSVTVTDNKGCIATNSISMISTPVIINITGNNPSCNGSADGNATVNIISCTGLATYLWSNGQTTQTATGLIAGTYTATLTDAVGCTGTASITLTDPPLLVASSSVSGTIPCNGGTVQVTVSASGGTPQYTGTGTFTVGAGNYTYTVTDSKGCTATTSVSISQPPALNVSNVKTNVSCNGGSNGAIIVTVSGGTAAYSYLWNTGHTTKNRSSLTAGTYTLTVTDSNGCTATTSAQISEPLTLNVSNLATNVTCNGSANGSIVVTATGGTPGYNYLWNNGSTAQNRTGLPPGTYTVTVSDANGCSATASSVITQPAVIANNLAKTNVTCFGGNNGSITTNVTGGTSPYSYLWTTGGTNSSISNLAKGTYTVTVTDSKGCTKSSSNTITQPANIVLTFTNVVAGCGLATAKANTVGGVQPYSYVWSNGSTATQITNVPSGVYTVTVTDGNGCTKSNTISLISTPLLVNSSQTNVNCNGGSDGTATALPICNCTTTYIWSNGQTTQTATGLNIGTYTVTVTNEEGCTATATVTITEPTPLVAGISPGNPILCHGGTGTAIVSASGGTPPYTGTGVQVVNPGNNVFIVTDSNGCTASTNIVMPQPPALNLTMGKTNLTCNGGTDGTANVTVTGGTPGYNYSWSNGETLSAISSLTAGVYTVTVTDANGCSATNSIFVTQPFILKAIKDSVANVTCNGGSDGVISFAPTGGTSPYSYLWNDGSTLGSRYNLPAGIYTITVTDANGCSVVVGNTVTQPAAMVVVKVATIVSCNGGSNGTITINNVTGGTAPFTYIWNNGSTIKNQTGLAAGVYTVTVTDAKGCTVSATQQINQPAAINIAAVKTNVSCNGGSNGSIILTITGGTGPFTYLWNNGVTNKNRTGLSAGTFTVTVTDSKGCTATASNTITQPNPLVITFSNVVNQCGSGSVTASATGGTTPYNFVWSNGSTNVAQTGLTNGTYTVTVTDANGCTSTKTQDFNSAQVSVTLAGTNIDCNGDATGSISATTGGGIAPFNYQWSNGQTSATATGLIAGNYDVTVTDATGCSKSASAALSENSAIIVTAIQNTQINCNGGTASITVSVSGGVGPYTGGPAGTFNVTAGTYTYTFVDSKGCSKSTEITITEPPVFSVTAVVSDITCNGSSNGSITVTTNGGTPGYLYIWNDGVTSKNRSGLNAGTYTVTATDANGCTATVSKSISEPDPIVLSTSKVDLTYYGASNGSATVSVTSGGVAPYSYLWSNSQTTATIIGLTAGTYTATVSDANGCSSTASVTLTEPAFLCSGFNSSHTSGYYAPQQNLPGGMAYQNFLNANFNTIWPGGMTLSSSCGTYTLTLTSAQAVLNFMPSSGSAGPLTQNWTNPLPSTLANQLAAQLVTLNCNIRFDQFDPNWAVSTMTFDQLVVDSGPLSGLTVGQVFQEGINKLTGCGSVYTTQELRSTISLINSSWYLGQEQNNIVSCPTPLQPKSSPSVRENPFVLNVFPNPATDQLNLSFNIGTIENCQVRILDMTGQIMVDETKDSFEGLNTFTYNMNNLPRGIYMVQFIMGNVTRQVKVVLQ